MGPSQLLCCVFFCFPLLQNDVSPLTIKSVYPHANVLMQFGAEHSPAPCDGHAEEAAAKIDGETKLGIELPKGSDHRNILLHKIGSYLALVMKALAKTVEPSEVLDGSSTHLDFHVDAELKEPESHLTITENHPNEVVLHTLWTGDGCQNVHVDHPHQSQGSVGPQLLVSSVPAEARTNGGLSVSNISPLNSLLGALARVGTPGNNPGGLNSQNIAVPLNPLVLQAILSRLQNANNNPTGNANLPPLVGIITEDEVEPEEGVANSQPNQRQSVENILRNILSSNRQILPGSVDPSGLLQNPLQAFIMASPSSLGGNISPFSQDNPQLRNALLSPSDLSQILENISQNPNVQFIPTGAAFGNGMNEPLAGALRSLLRNQVAQNVNGLNLPLTGNSDPSSALNALENIIPETNNLTPINSQLLSPLNLDMDNNPVAVLHTHQPVNAPCAKDSQNHEHDHPHSNEAVILPELLNNIPISGNHLIESTVSPLHEATSKSNEQPAKQFESQRAAVSASDSGKLAILESLKSVNYIPKEGVPFHVETHKINKLIDSRLSPEDLLHDQTHKFSAAELGLKAHDYKVYPPLKKDHPTKYVQFKQKFYDRDRSLDSDLKTSLRKHSEVLHEENERARNLPLDDIDSPHGVLSSGNTTDNVNLGEAESLLLTKLNETQIHNTTTSENAVNMEDSFSLGDDNRKTVVEVEKQSNDVAEGSTIKNLINLNNTNENGSFLTNLLISSKSADPKFEPSINEYFPSSNNTNADRGNQIMDVNTGHPTSDLLEMKKEQPQINLNSPTDIYVTPQQILNNAPEVTMFALLENIFNRSVSENLLNSSSPEIQFPSAWLRQIDFTDQNLSDNLTLAKPTPESLMNYEVVSAASPFDPEDSKQTFSELLSNETTLSPGVVNNNDYGVMVVTPSSHLSEDWKDGVQNFPEYEEIISDVNQIPYGFFIEESDYNMLSTPPQDKYFDGSKSDFDQRRSGSNVNSGYLTYFIDEGTNGQYVPSTTYADELASSNIYQMSPQPNGHQSKSLPPSSELLAETVINSTPAEFVSTYRNFAQGNEMRLAKDYPISTFKTGDVEKTTIPSYDTEYTTVSQEPNMYNKNIFLKDQLRAIAKDFNLPHNQYNPNQLQFKQHTIRPSLDSDVSVTENVIRSPYETNEIESHQVSNSQQMHSFGAEPSYASEHKLMSNKNPTQYLFIDQDGGVQSLPSKVKNPIESLLLEILSNNNILYVDSRNPSAENPNLSHTTITTPPSFTEKDETPLFTEPTTKNYNIDQLKLETRMQRNNIPVEVSSDTNSYHVKNSKPLLKTGYPSPKADLKSDISAVYSQQDSIIPKSLQPLQIRNEPLTKIKHIDEMYRGTVEPLPQINILSDEALLSTYDVEEETFPIPYSSIEETSIPENEIDISEKFNNKGVFTVEPTYGITSIKSLDEVSQKFKPNNADISYNTDQTLKNDKEVYRTPYQMNEIKFSGRKDELLTPSTQENSEPISNLLRNTYLINNLPNSYAPQNKMAELSSQGPTYDVTEESFHPQSPIERQLFEIIKNIPMDSIKEIESYDIAVTPKPALLEKQTFTDYKTVPKINETSDDKLNIFPANLIVQTSPDQIYTSSPYEYEVTDQPGRVNMPQVSFKKISEYYNTEEPISKLTKDDSSDLPLSNAYEKKASRTIVIPDDYKSQLPIYESEITIDDQFETPGQENIKHIIIQRPNKTVTDRTQHSFQQISTKDLEVGHKKPEISPELLQYIVNSMRDMSFDKSGSNVIGNPVSESKDNMIIQMEVRSSTISPNDYSNNKYQNPESFDLIEVANDNSWDSKKGTAIYSYVVGEDGLKPRLICLTDHRDNIEILRSLKEDITKLKQKLNCE